MKCNNPAAARLVAVALVITSLVPLVAAAQKQPGAGEQLQEFKKNNFCTSLKGRAASERFGYVLQQRLDRLDARRAEVFKTWSQNREGRGQAMKAVRAAQDANLDMVTSALESKYPSADQKAAIAAFRSAAVAAQAARREAVDKAVNTFRFNLDAVRNRYKAIMDAALTTFINSIRTAEDNASADCDAGKIAPANIRESMQTSIETARTALLAAKPDKTAMGEEVESMAKTRQKEVAEALATFKAAMEKARADLKAALGEAN